MPAPNDCLHASGRGGRCHEGIRPPAQLLRLHRHGLINVLVLGGTPTLRAEVAYTFHQESPLRAGAFVPVDCVRHQPRLRRALECWVSGEVLRGSEHPLWAAERGTLYLDPIEALTPQTQRLLLTFACRFLGNAVEATDWVGRLVVGNPEDLSPAVAEGRFLGALYDTLDKLRVELDLIHRGGAA